MKFINYSAPIVLVLLGLSGCGGKPMPKSYLKNLDTSTVNELSDKEINVLLGKQAKLEFKNLSHDPQVRNNYNYQFNSESKIIKGKFFGDCSFNGKIRPISECESWNFHAPNDSFLEGIENTKQYFNADKHVAFLDKMNVLKKKISVCQASIKTPTTTLIDDSGKLGDVVKYIKMSKVNHSKTELLDYLDADSSSFTCVNLKDTFSLNLSSEQFSLNKSEYSFKYGDINKESNKLPDIKLGQVYYQFLKNSYEIGDKFVKVVLTPSSDKWSSSIRTKVSVENLTSEFLELQGISIYYGSGVYEYLGAGDSHIDISPETINAIIPNKLYKDLVKLIEIKSKDDTIKLGLAIKYKVKSTNQIQTLYKTVQLPISELK